MKFESDQEVFEFVVRKLFIQNEKCGYTNDKGEFKCMYRYEGLKCAAGHVIEDDEYNVDMEDMAISTVLSSYYKLKDLDLFTDVINDLQEIHDFSPIESWFSNFDSIKIQYDFSTDLEQLANECNFPIPEVENEI